MEPRQESGLPAGVDSGASYASASTKRKRSSSPPANPRSSSSSKTRHEAAHIDYLSRSLEEDVPLISGEENCTTMNRYIDGYEAVLQHHESLAANMGGKPLGQTLMKRFDRLWDGPVKVLYSQKEGSRSVSWLDVVDHYRKKPRDFNLLENRHGMRMCHVWIRSCKVEVLEEDFSLIKSGMPQKMIPPQPLAEDEEQELGTLDLLESRLLNVISQVDGVSGRARSLNHRLRARRAAIIVSHGGSAPLGSNGTVQRTESKSSASAHDPVTATHGLPSNALNGHPSVPMSSTSATTGFVAVNTARATGTVAPGEHPDRAIDRLGGEARKVHADLLRRFSSQAPPTPSHKPSQHAAASTSKLSTPRPSSAHAHTHTHIPHPHSAPSHKSGSTQAKPTLHGAAYTSHQSSLASISVREDGPYKAIMLAKMEHMNKGDPVTPPCDRCRRLGMGCARNLTACMGCTRKHAKCTWLDVREGELTENGISVPTAPAAIEREPTPVHGSGRDFTTAGDDVVGRLAEERDREHERRREKEDRRRERERERELDPTAAEERENQKRARREQMERVRQREWREEVELEALRLERRFEAEARQKQKSRLEREREGERRPDRVLIPAEPLKKREPEKQAAHAFREGEKEPKEDWKVDKAVDEEEIAKEGNEKRGKEKDGQSDGGAPTRDTHRREEEDEPMES